MNTIGGKVSSDYGWEITAFRKIRDISDGLSILDVKINFDRYIADHSPRFEFDIVLLNHTLVEISIYYLHHRDSD